MDLFAGIIVRDQVLWLVCGVFYFIDNFRHSEARKFIMAEGLNGQWAPIFPMYGYRFGRRPVVILNLFLPWLAAIPMHWLTPSAFEPRHLRCSHRLLRVYQRRIGALRILSTFLFVLLFVIGPSVTYKFGLTFGILVVLPSHVAAMLLLIGLLIWDRRFWGMSWMKITALAFECAVCPGIFVNVCRKVTLAHASVNGDAIAYSLVYGGSDLVTTIGRRFELLIEDLRENGELQSLDEPLIAEYRLRLRETIDDG